MNDFVVQNETHIFCGWIKKKIDSNKLKWGIKKGNEMKLIYPTKDVLI